MELIEDYIDYLGERDFVNSLTVEEQTLYKCQLRDTLGFAKFSLCVKWKQFVNSLLKAGKDNEEDTEE